MYLLVVMLFFKVFVFGQNHIEKLTKSIVEEGKMLYKSEMASWYGTDLFLENYTNKSNVGGYFSYGDGEITKCVFYSKEKTPKVIGTLSFDDSFSLQTATTNLEERNFSKSEQELYKIRSKALQIINSDTIFKFYKNTNYNIIPIISNNERKVYILTGPQNSGVMIFGNDYLLTFDKKNKLLNRKQLHKNIIVTPYGEKTEDGNAIVGGMHTHLPETGDFITATDICTLMLYEKIAGWESYAVVSEKYLSTWDCLKDELTVVPMKAVKKIIDSKEEE